MYYGGVNVYAVADNLSIHIFVKSGADNSRHTVMQGRHGVEDMRYAFCACVRRSNGCIVIGIGMSD